MSRRRKQLLISVGIILLLSIILIYALTADVQSLLLLTIVTALLHIAVCGSVLYFCYYNPAENRSKIDGNKKE